jgi:hypothetical protein
VHDKADPLGQITLESAFPRHQTRNPNSATRVNNPPRPAANAESNMIDRIKVTPEES